MVFVKKQPGDSPDSLIRKFGKKVLYEGLIPEMRRREFHLKPSLAKKYKRELARKMAKQFHS